MSQALDYFLVTAWIEEKQTTGVVLVHKNDPGVSIEETWDMMAMRATGSHDLVLNEVTLEDNKLVELLQGPRELSKTAGCSIFRRFILAWLKLLETMRCALPPSILQIV